MGVASTLKKFPSSDGPSLRTMTNAVSENRQATVAQPDKNRERVSSILRINDGQPLSEEQEQQIINDAQDILNKFPISVGEDTNGQNPEWETIQHPGTEALKHLHGESYTPTGMERSASDIAGILSGKKVKGGIAKEDSNVDEGYMRVPKFWDPEPFGTISDIRDSTFASDSSNANDTFPRDGVRRYLGNFGSRLMTPTEAKSIGSHITTNDGKVLETIFVAVASYRDYQCSTTVESAFSRATHPERIRVAVVNQIHGDDKSCAIPPEGPCELFPHQAMCRYKDQIDIFTVDAGLSVGPVFARHLGHRLYRGEYFAMQSDAHVIFVSGWDDEIVEQWHSAKNEMAVLSTYLSGVEDHIDLKTGLRTSKSRPIMCNSDYEGQGEIKHLRHGQQPEGVPFIHDTPTLNPFWAAGFSFGRGHFVVNVPYDQVSSPLTFFCSEMLVLHSNRC